MPGMPGAKNNYDNMPTSKFDFEHNFMQAINYYLYDYGSYIGFIAD